MRTPQSQILDPWWVTGFVEGEGCFTYSRSGSGSIALYFAVKLTRADRTLLEALQRFFGGVGIIYDVGPRVTSPGSGFTKAASYYRVCRREHLGRILAHFDTYPPRGAKANSYRIWREMVLLKLESVRPLRDRLNALAALLSAASPRNGPWSSEGLQRPRSASRAFTRHELSGPL